MRYTNVCHNFIIQPLNVLIRATEITREKKTHKEGKKPKHKSVEEKPEHIQVKKDEWQEISLYMEYLGDYLMLEEVLRKVSIEP